jgi:chitodextrinase
VISGGSTYEQEFTVSVTDLVSENVAPTDISLSASSITENSASGTTVGTLSATDADAGDTATFTLVSGAGDTDNASFTIDGTALKTAASFDYETKSSYSIRVRVTDSGAATYEKAFTVSVTNVEDAVPSTPTGLAATKITHNSISLSWGAASDDIAVVGYNVFRNGLYVASTTGTKYTITGLNPLTSHNITVQAYDTVRNRSARSTALAVSTIAPPDLIPPTAPTSLTAVGVTKNHIMFQWSGATDNVGVTRYNIYLNGTYSKTATSTQSEFLSLTSSTAYNVRIQAVDAAGNRSPLSEVLTLTTLDGIAPSVPDGLVSSLVTKTGFRVTWNASTDNGAVTKYNVYRNGTYVQTVTGTSYTFNGLEVNLTHQITVLAIDDAGNRSAQSTALSVATTFVSDPIAPTAASDLTSSNITKTSARVTWTAATDNVAVTFYNIYRNGAYVATVSGTTTAYNLAGLTAGTSYNITVRALDAAKNFTNSTALSVTTLP